MKIWIDDEEEKDIDSSQELLEEEPEEDNSDRCIVHAIFFELAFGAVLYLKSATAAFSYLIALSTIQQNQFLYYKKVLLLYLRHKSL